MKQINRYMSLILLMLGCSCSNEQQAESLNNSSNTVRPVTVADSTIGQESQRRTTRKPEWQFEKVDGSTIFFKNGQKVKTTLFDLRYIGQLATKHKAPYLILSGRSCTACDENISIYIYSPSDGEMKSGGKQPRYSYPGKEMDYMTKELIFESKMYYGNCLNPETPSVIWVDRTLNGKNWDNSLFILSIENDDIHEKEIKNENEIKQLLSKVIKCKELPGTIMTSEP
jgi:hypothetical protein